MAEDTLKFEDVKRNLNKFAGGDMTDEQLQNWLVMLKAAGQKVLLARPRRGIHVELLNCLPYVKDELTRDAIRAEVPFETSAVKSGDAALNAELHAEKWREVECLTVTPFNFAALKQLPELQQLIAFSAVGVINTAGDPDMGLARVAGDLQQHHTLASQGAAASSMQQLMPFSRCSDRYQRYTELCTDSLYSLLQRMSPHMRLALAAEVAAGMLCPGQPAPPDTPEHGAVLRLFINQAHKQVHGELKEHIALAEAARKGTAAKSTKLHKLWGHAGSSSEQQQQQDAPGPPATDLLPPPGKVRSWPLSPHIDLRLQLPSQQLLEHLVLRVLDHERQQEAGEQGQQGRDQYQQADEPQQPSDCSEQDDSLQQLLQQFAERLQQQQGQDGAASAFGALLDKSLVESLRQGLQGPAHCQNSSSSSSSSKSPPGQNEVSVGAAGDTHGSSSRSSPFSSNNAAAAAASAAEQARLQGRLPQELCSAATSLAARCVLEQVALGWQQWLPLQALQLLTAVRQLEATARAACATGPPESQASATVAQQHLVQQSLLLLQHVQDLRDAREPAATAAAAAATASSAAEPTQHHNSSSSSSHWPKWHQQSGSSTARANAGCLSPAQFFAADGPLAGGLGREPTGLSLWQLTGISCQSAALGHNMGSSSCTDGSSTSSQGSSSSTAYAGPGPNQLSGSQLPQQPCKQLVGLAQATALSHILQTCVTQLLCGSLLHAAMANRPFTDLHDADAIQLKGSALLSLVLAEIKQHSGRVCAAGMAFDALIVMWALPRAMAVAVAQLRELLCELLGLPGYDAVAWSNIMHQAELHSSAELQKAREGPFSRGPDSDSDSDGIDSGSEDGADEDNTAAGMAGWWSSSSSSGATGGAEALHMQQLLKFRLQRDGELLRPVHAMLQQHETRYKRDQEAIKQAAVSLREMASTAASSFAPLQQWHSRQQERQQHLAVEASAWWASKQRVAAAIAGATGKAAAPGPAATEHPLAMSSSNDSMVWLNGQHDHNPLCPLCQKEQQQQQQCAITGPSSANHSTAFSASSTSSSPSTSCQWPVPYDDPFLWRRLLWRLLGKLSPEAQAFYATHLSMCPHCCSSDCWDLVANSLVRCVWSPDGVDLIDIVLFSSERQEPGKRVTFLRQYSRALNTAFGKGYHPSTVLLSKQVLLALSPLHHQVLPPAEVAHFLPSSFGPAIGKALMQALCDVPVLDGFEHQHCPLQLWHVWWHVGLRVYQQLQQRQEDVQQLLKSSRNGGCSRINSASSSCSSAVALYQDNDARLYAVGFATRQLLGGQATAAGSHARANLHSRLQCSLRSLLCTAALKTVLPEEQPHQPTNHRRLRIMGLRQLLVEDFIVPGLAPRFLPILTEAACGPHDPLVPLQQQRGAGSSRSSRSMKSHRRKLVNRFVLGLSASVVSRLGCPEEWQAQQDMVAAECTSGISQAGQQARGVLDVSALMHADPLFEDGLQGPDCWWQLHQELMVLQCCDGCAKLIPGKVLECPVCHCAVYCNEECRQKNWNHEQICEKLVQVQQRYTPAAMQPNSASSSSAVPVLQAMQQEQPSPCSQGRALQHLRGLPILTSLLEPSGYEAGLLGHQTSAGLYQDWPQVFAGLQERLAAAERF